MWEVNIGAGLGSISSSGSNRRLHFVFDSDADTDPDTEAWGEGSGPGSSSFLTVSAQSVAHGGRLGIGIDSDEALGLVSPIPEGVQRIAGVAKRTPGSGWKRKQTWWG